MRNFGLLLFGGYACFSVFYLDWRIGLAWLFLGVAIPSVKG
jgi:hypothetical protein